MATWHDEVITHSIIIINLKCTVRSTAVSVQRKLHVGKRKRNGQVFRLDLNVDGVLDGVNYGGREFHVCDVAAGRARLPMVQM